jgi:malonyl-CoA/methylmalonyl-CoA synthetase
MPVLLAMGSPPCVGAYRQPGGTFTGPGTVPARPRTELTLAVPIASRPCASTSWSNPEATDAAFLDGWLRTGDVAVREPDGCRLLGRASVDIIKSGGEKVSALEVEVLRTHPDIADCAVVGVPDEEWSERVCAAVVPRPGTTLDSPALREWGKERLAPAKVPSRLAVVESLPRNAMGKVTKPDVKRIFDTTT